MPFANEDQGALHALLALSASYRKVYESRRSSGLEEVELSHRTQTMYYLRASLSNRQCCVTIMLIVHYGVVNTLEEECWSVHFKAANQITAANLHHIGVSPSSVFIAYQAILARTALPLYDDRIPQTTDYEWLLYGNEADLTQVDSITGLSREMLFIIATITYSSGVSLNHDFVL